MITKLQARALIKLNNSGGIMKHDDFIGDYCACKAQSDIDEINARCFTVLSLIRRKFVIEINGDYWKITDAGREALARYEANKGCNNAKM